MNFIKQTIKSFSRFEIVLSISSLFLEILLFLFIPKKNYISFFASIVGILMIIFISKGNILGKYLSIAFAILYSVVSYYEAFYGEMIAYLAINIPITIVSIVLWFKHPYANNRAEVQIKKNGPKDFLLVFGLSIPFTIGAYFLLEVWGTSNLWLNVASLFSCIVADLFSWTRSKYYAIAYCVNDIVIIAMWIIASIEALENLAMVGCFVIFLVIDAYGFIDWQKREKLQSNNEKIDTI